MDYDDFWFKRTFPQIFLLVQARLERNERSNPEASDDTSDKSPVRQVATMEEMSMIGKSFGARQSN